MSRIEDEVCKKIAQRAEVGKSKYGVTMETSPISRLEWLIHAQEEAMDLAVYLQKLIEMEREQLKFHSYSIESAESVYRDGTKRRNWTHEDRQELIRLYEEGKSRNEIAKIMCRPFATVNVFCTRYKQTGKLEGQVKHI